MTECSRCKRPGCDAGSNDPEANAECDGYVMGYRRGLADGVKMAKERVRYCDANVYRGDDIGFDWSDVDAALEEATR